MVGRLNWWQRESGPFDVHNASLGRLEAEICYEPNKMLQREPKGESQCGHPYGQHTVQGASDGFFLVECKDRRCGCRYTDNEIIAGRIWNLRMHQKAGPKETRW